MADPDNPLSAQEQHSLNLNDTPPVAPPPKVRPTKADIPDIEARIYDKWNKVYELAGARQYKIERDSSGNSHFYFVEPAKAPDVELTGDPKIDKMRQLIASANGGAEQEVQDSAIQGILNEITALEREKDFAKTSASFGPAVESYMTSENRKSGEITRQYNDFKSRAQLYEDLAADEQTYGRNADEQNIANEAAIQKYGFANMPSYAHRPMGTSLANILRPSLPDYVRPDYRLNAAVGLPGPEGFDDPNYDANGMPLYAFGTPPPVGIRIPLPLQPKVPWPWGVK